MERETFDDRVRKLMDLREQATVRFNHGPHPYAVLNLQLDVEGPARDFAFKAYSLTPDLVLELAALRATIARVEALCERWKGRITADHWAPAACEVEAALRGET